MSTTQRNGAPAPAVVTLTFRDPIAVRAALIRGFVASAHLVADLAAQHTLDPLNALDDDIEVTIERTLDLAGSLLETIVAIEALGVFEGEDGEGEPDRGSLDHADATTPPPTPGTRPRHRCRPAATLAIAAPTSLAGVALLTRAARRRHPHH